MYIVYKAVRNTRITHGVRTKKLVSQCRNVADRVQLIDMYGETWKTLMSQLYRLVSHT